jgi:lipopolysaccharide/colanic/teichoic acid biosynthesis glycosyltransferase
MPQTPLEQALISEKIVVSRENVYVLRKRRFQLAIKRLLDILFALLGLTVILPLLLVITIVVKLDSKGPALFIQGRYGKNGKEFRALKFRTMYVDSSIGNLSAPEKGDKRVTRVGWFLRKTSIDELPQLINVLLGDMSIVGPRAVPRREIELRLEKLNNEYPENEELHKKYMKIRELVRPGITGMAQAYGRSSLTTLQATKYDVYYAEKYSLLLDIKIIAKTMQTVIFQKGAN